MKILFASPHALLDTSNGAALATRELLEQLARRGFHCQAVTASVFDPIRGLTLEESLARMGLELAFQPADESATAVVTVGGVTHTVLKTNRSQRRLLSPREKEAFLSLLEERLTEFQPDLLLTYGGMETERKIHLLSRQKGVPVVFYLLNSLYQKAETFSNVDLTLVVSRFLQEYYADRLGIRSRILYPIFTTDRCRIKQHLPRYITFINPEPLKGLGLFTQIARQALRQIPRAEFLVVEGRWGRKEMEEARVPLDQLPNVKIIPHQRDIRTIYSLTRVLLYPSFWVEAFGRTVVEAQMNGVPVVASRRGGIPEALNGGGFLIELPERCARDYRFVPPAKEIQPWMDRLRDLVENEESYSQARERARSAADLFRPEKIVDEAVGILHELYRGRIP